MSLKVAIVFFIGMSYLSAQASFLDCQTANWWQPEFVLEAPEEMAKFIAVENDGELVKLQNSTSQSVFLEYKNQKAYRLVNNKVYRRVKVKSKHKWLKIQHTLLSDTESSPSVKVDAAYLIMDRSDIKRFSVSSKTNNTFFFEQLEKCGPGRLAGRPDAAVNFEFNLNLKKESHVINGKATLMPNPNYNPEVPCCTVK